MKEKVLSEYNNLKEWFTKEKIIAFLVTLLIGFMTHIKIIVGLFSNQDGLWEGMQYQKLGEWQVALGRWGIVLAERLNNYVLIPSVATVTSIVFIAIASIFLIDLFDIKNKISIVIASISMVIGPSVMLTFLYINTSMAYALAFLISIMSVWFLFKFKYKKTGFVISLLLAIFTLSIYQSYIGVVAGLSLMYIVVSILKGSMNIKESLIYILKTGIIVVLGTALYYLTSNIIIKIMGISFSTYNNADGLSISEIFLNIIPMIKSTYVKYFDYYFTDNIFWNTNYRRDILYTVFYIVLAMIFVARVIKLNADEKKEKIIKVVLATIILFLIPVALNCINIMLGRDCIYEITSTQLILVIPFALALVEGLFEVNILYVLGMIAIVPILMTYYIADNVSYTTIEMTYKQSEFEISKIMARIENMEEYNNGMKILLAGIIDDENAPRYSNLYNFGYGVGARNSVFHGDYSGQKSTWIRFLEVICGTRINMPDEEQYKRIVESDEFKELEIYPSTHSIKKIEDCIVVRLKRIPAVP